MIHLERSCWFSTPGQFLVCFFLLELLFTQKTNQQHTRYLLLKLLNNPPTQFHHELTYSHNCRWDDRERRTKKQIGEGSVVKAKVGYVEDNKREGISRRVSKQVVVCFHTVMGEKILLVQIKYFQKKYTSSSLLVLRRTAESQEVMANREWYLNRSLERITELLTQPVTA